MSQRARHMGAHPRLRGADPLEHAGVGPEVGSSPLTRGGRLMVHAQGPRRGLIPAYAGRTLVLDRPRGFLWAHPRLRGADGRVGEIGELVTGSSPLTRGGPILHSTASSCGGLIPAYAGRTLGASILCGVNRAHPRLRGADHRYALNYPYPWGSSPLTRGGPGAIGYFITALGLIPAYAGRTHPEREKLPPPGAHPRLRGADLDVDAEHGGGLGSSPLTRGGQPWCLTLRLALRLIPAYAGRTPVRRHRRHPN